MILYTCNQYNTQTNTQHKEKKQHEKNIDGKNHRQNF